MGDQNNLALSVLVCSVAERFGDTPVIDQLWKQAKGYPVEVIVLTDNRSMSIGRKRNQLIASAVGEYVVFVDDDDMVSDDYIVTILDAARSGADVLPFRLDYIRNGKKHWTVHQSLHYTDMAVDPTQVYRRPIRNSPRHTCAVKRDIAERLPFADASYNEDSDWAQRLLEVAVTERVINKTLYFYRDNPATSVARQYAHHDDVAYKEWEAAQ